MKNTVAKIASVAALSIVLVGCGTPTVEELLADEQLLTEMAIKCDRGEGSEELCANVLQAAQKKAMGQLNQLMSSFK